MEENMKNWVFVISYENKQIEPKGIGVFWSPRDLFDEFQRRIIVDGALVEILAIQGVEVRRSTFDQTDKLITRDRFFELVYGVER
jgi:hypothetical protein